MKLFNFFKPKPKLSPEQEKELLEQMEQQRIEKEKFDNREIRGYCGHCDTIIELGDPWTKQLGKHYHRKCWKEVRKEGWG
jgi:hypothetical protein